MSKYLTTTLPYINSEPHLGFALELVQTDILARHFRLTGEKVFFNTGTDEHGAKIWEKNKEDTKSFCDAQSKKFQDLIPLLNISTCNFIRTTDERHKHAVAIFWERCKKDIYKAKYNIKYCTGCELEKQNSELRNGKCPYHPLLTLEERAEENYYFKLSAYADTLLNHFEKHPDFVVPKYRHVEATNFLKSDLKDISISRLANKLPWGIPVPNDPEHVIYVWFDALINYISALGWPEKDISEFWPGYQFAGKDNLRQQSIIWSGMLLAAGLSLPKQIFVHGFLTQNGEKISKSAAVSLSPQTFLDKFPVDFLRYWIARECSQFDDTDLNYENVQQNYNDNLSKGLGNLFSRILKMAVSNEVYTDFNCQYHSPALDNFDIRGGINNIWAKISELDGFIQQTEPFRHVKVEETKSKAKEDIKHLLQELYWIAIHLQPYLPKTAALMIEHLNNREMIQLFPTYK